MNVIPSWARNLDVEAECKAMRKTAKKLARSKKKSLQFLVNAGILTKEGKLRKEYGGDG